MVCRKVNKMIIILQQLNGPGVLGTHLDGGHVVWIPLEFSSSFGGKHIRSMWVFWFMILICRVVLTIRSRVKNVLEKRLVFRELVW
jgi:hypothetical protein